MPKDLIIGVKTIGEQTQLSITGQRVLSSQWLQSKLIQSGKWELAKTRILHVESYAQSHLFSSDYLNQFNDVVRVVFVGYSTESKPEKRFEEKQLKQQFDLSQHDEQRIDHCNIARSAAAAGLKALFDDNRDLTTDVLVDDFDGYDRYAAEGAYLEAYQFYLDEKKKQELKKTELSLLDKTAGEDSWNRGKLIADCQNFAKWLEQLPANYCTPSIFCDLAKQRLQGTKVQVEVHDEKWAKEHNMNLFLAVSHGSDLAPKVLELRYLNNPNKSNKEIDLAFVGKGVTFDSGGISLKASTDMKLMKVCRYFCPTLAYLLTY
jgi:aminopeptidase